MFRVIRGAVYLARHSVRDVSRWTGKPPRNGPAAAMRDERHFRGMQPVGPYPIHIIVKNGRTMVLGIVDGAADRQIAEVRAREGTGVFEVENSLTVARQERSAR